MEKMKRLPAIKRYFEQADKIAPNGGRPLPTSEFKSIGQDGLRELGDLAARELGVEIEA